MDRKTHKISELLRFHEKYDICPETGCWNWTGSVTTQGYAKLRVGSTGDEDNPRRLVTAHRWYYEYENNVELGHFSKQPLDHLCRNRRCVNPEHLEPVTKEENERRGKAYIRREYCMSGLHKMEGDNVYWKKNGRRQCKACMRLRGKEYAARKRAQKLS